MIEKLLIKALILILKRKDMNSIELVIRSNGYTYYKRNLTEEESIEETLKLIK